MPLQFEPIKISFHIIIGLSSTKKGNYIGFDFHKNSIFIPNEIDFQNNLKSIEDISPIYCVAREDRIYFDNRKRREFLKCILMSADYQEVTNNIKNLPQFNNPDYLEQTDYLEFIESMNFCFNQYNAFIQYNKSHEFKIDLSNNNKTQNSPLVLISENCIQIKPPLHSFNTFYGYDFQDKNDEISFDPTLKELVAIGKLDDKFKSANKFKLTLIPLYPSLRSIYKSISYGSDTTYRKIVVKESLKEFTMEPGMFYKTTNSKYEFEKLELQVHMVDRLDFKYRLKKHFNSLFVYNITPLIYDYNEVYSVDTIKQDLLNITEQLEKNKILNVIISPPQFLEYQVEEHVYYCLNPPEEDERFYDWSELGEQEMRIWDTETDGFWRIDNDYD